MARRRPARFAYPLAWIVAVWTALPACAPAPICESFGPEEGRANHIQPFEVAVDPWARRAFSTSLSTLTLGIHDLDAQEMIAAAPLAERPLVFPDVAVDDLGVVWVVSYGNPPVIRLHGHPSMRLYPQTSIMLARRVVPVPGGGAVILGVDTSGEDLLALVDAAGQEILTRSPERTALGLIPLGPDGLGLLLGGSTEGALAVLSWDSLADVAGHDLPFIAQRGARLDDGSVVVSSLEQIGLVAADGAEPVGWTAGIENYDAISLGDRALVLDRIGPDDPNLGVARIVGPDGVDDAHTFTTAKNTGFGALDPTTGLVWANSEGTAELVALSPDAGTVEAAILTGTHLDGIAFDRSADGVLYVTGRLSDSVLGLNEFAVAAESSAVPWPFSPMTDFERGIVWVLSQTDAAVHGLDKDTLEVVVTHDLEPEYNALLTFGSMVLHPETMNLLVAESSLDRVVELDPDEGTLLNTWDLGGPALTDPDLVGHLQVFFDSETDALILCRSTDARVQRLDPATGQLETVWLEGLEDVVGVGNAVDFATLLRKERLLYIGGVAVDADTLERLPDEDRDVFRVIGPHPSEEDEILAVDPARRTLLRLGREGEQLGTLTFTDADANAGLFRVDPWREQVLMVRSADARVCSFPVGEIE